LASGWFARCSYVPCDGVATLHPTGSASNVTSARTDCATAMTRRILGSVTLAATAQRWRCLTCKGYSLAREAMPPPVARGGRIADCDADRGFKDGRQWMRAGSAPRAARQTAERCGTPDLKPSQHADGLLVSNRWDVPEQAIENTLEHLHRPISSLSSACRLAGLTSRPTWAVVTPTATEPRKEAAGAGGIAPVDIAETLAGSQQSFLGVRPPPSGDN